MALLELRGVGKDFGAIRALSDVDLSIEPGEAVGLMGDNGAGKSTLVKIIAGNFAPTRSCGVASGRSAIGVGVPPVRGTANASAKEPLVSAPGARFVAGVNR